MVWLFTLVGIISYQEKVYFFRTRGTRAPYGKLKLQLTVVHPGSLILRSRMETACSLCSHISHRAVSIQNVSRLLSEGYFCKINRAVCKHGSKRKRNALQDL